MRIIIDGYNLFKSIRHTPYIDNNQMAKLIKILCSYAQTKRHTIIVFFDSGPTFLREYRASSNYLSVCYVGQGVSADQAIIEYVSVHKQRPLLMVSNDNALKASVILHGVDTIKSLEFWDYVTQPLSYEKPQRSSIHKCSADNNPELDALMQAIDVPYQTQDDKSIYCTAGLSKKEKRIALLRKKL